MLIVLVYMLSLYITRVFCEFVLITCGLCCCDRVWVLGWFVVGLAGLYNCVTLVVFVGLFGLLGFWCLASFGLFWVYCCVWFLRVGCLVVSFVSLWLLIVLYYIGFLFVLLSRFGCLLCLLGCEFDSVVWGFSCFGVGSVLFIDVLCFCFGLCCLIWCFVVACTSVLLVCFVVAILLSSCFLWGCCRICWLRVLCDFVGSGVVVV